MRTIAFLLGAPGVGKTTVTRRLLGEDVTFVRRWTVGTSYCAAGSYTGGMFDGPDMLPLSHDLLAGMIEQLDTLIDADLSVVLDGARFAQADLRDLAKMRGRCVAVVLSASVATVQRRRLMRDSPPMSDAWVQAQIDRVHLFARTFGHRYLVDAERMPTAIADDVRRYAPSGGWPWASPQTR